MRWSEEEYDAWKKGKKVPAKKKVAIAGGYRSNVRGWREIGGKRYYFKSLWEINYAHYLEFEKRQGVVFEWEYEPKKFKFPKEDYAAGPFSYTPDFRVWLDKNKNLSSWVEVKGYMTQASKRKIKRFEKHYPEEGKLVILGKEWFHSAGQVWGEIVPNWEKLDG